MRKAAQIWTPILVFFAIALGSLNAQQATADRSTTLSESQAEAIGTEIYIYGYPLVTMDLTKKVMTNTASSAGMKAPVGQFINARTYPDASFKDVTAPNADTLYSTAWLDLSKEPYILHVPNEHGRYYLMPMLDGWTNVFASPGTRTTGTDAADFAITGPGWEGELPEGVQELKSPTSMVWVLGRTYSTGTPEDYKAVHAIQDQYKLTPLSAYGKEYTPAKGIFDPNLDMKTPVRDQVNAMDAATFFNRLALLMKDNPPAPEDAPIVAKMAKIGMIPGQAFDMSKLDSDVVRGLKRVPQLAFERIKGHLKKAGVIDHGWVVTLNTGDYGTNYLQRAFITAIGLGANLPEDAIYPNTGVDSEGDLLDGDNEYVLHFPKGQTPPVKGFWSLTMYNDQYFFVANPLNRYTLSPRNPLKYNSDGSLDLYIQNESPGTEKESNWLPAPKDKFNLMLRLYWPEESVINGTWKPPAVEENGDD